MGGRVSAGGNSPDLQKMKCNVEQGLDADKKFFCLLDLL